MPRLFRNHSLGSAFQRLSRLVRGVGVQKTFSLMVSYVDDQHLRLFDRRYGIKTSGYISLASTSFAPDRLPDATIYAPVNGWAFRRLLHELNLPRSLHFVDLGCGLGRACILAGEYGFDKVTGVELASELCAMARKNIASCRLPAGRRSTMEAASLGKPVIIIYSERMMHDDSYAKAFSGNRVFRKVREMGMYGQAFFIYECGTPFAKMDGGHPSKSALA